MRNLLKAITWEMMFQRSCVATGWPDTVAGRCEFVRRAKLNSGA
jgi:hypothetical protein